MIEPGLAVDEGDAQPAKDSPVPQRPGQQLRSGREAQGLSIDDVAEVLRFSRRQLEAAEADDYASLPGATFTRGLVRSYAKLLKMPPDPLLAQVSLEVPSVQAEVVPPANFGVTDNGESAGLSLGRAVLAVIIIVLAAVGFATYLLPDGMSSAVSPTGGPAAATLPIVPSAPVVAVTADAQSASAVAPSAFQRGARTDNGRDGRGAACRHAVELGLADRV